MRRTVAIVLKGYPRLSETFIANEIRALEIRGLNIHLVSLRHPTDPDIHPVHREIQAPVLYLPEYLYRDPMRVLRGWRAARKHAGWRAALKCFLGDLRRDKSPNRIRRFGQALVLAHEMPDHVGAIHAHFLHTPASVARYCAMIRGLDWTGSAHAKDIWLTPDWELSEKIADCAWLTTCSVAARDHLVALTAEPGKIALTYHGIDPLRFPPPPTPVPGREAARDGGDPADPLRILAVGRAVEKKGFNILLDALALLPPSLHWRFEHVGGGVLLDRLRRQADAVGIADRVAWRGAMSQDLIVDRYRDADLFVLPSRIADDGDRDGLPNVLLEAQSQSLACIASRVSAVPELIADGETGVLVAPDDAAALAAAIEQLARDPARRQDLGRAGAARTREAFSFDDGIESLAGRFGLATTSESRAPCASHSMRR
jgi:glycosyltransferase involved in cell wall biosynthesis